MKLTNLTVILLPVLALTACGRRSSESQETANTIGQTVNASLTNLGGMGDDASGGQVSAAIELPKKSAIQIALAELFLPKNAWAAGLYCSRTLSVGPGTCVRDVNCSVGPFSWSGEVVLTFSNGTNCLNPSIDNPGDYFTRKANFNRTAFAYTVQTISDAHNNYLGESISGGSKVTRQANLELSLEILGVSKVLTAKATDAQTGNSGGAVTIADMSFKTTEPVLVNHLSRLGRVIRSGKTTIDHNRLKYTAVHSYKDITWAELNCPFPTSGEIDITFTGSETGTAKVVFNGCGSFSVTRNGQSANSSMDASE